MALEAELPVLALPEVVVDLARLPLLAQPLVLVQLPHLALLPEEVVVEVVPQLTRSFSAAMAGVLPPPGPPMYKPVPRSRCKPKLRPCPLA